MKRFGHAGDLGDIIYALPAIRAQGGGALVLFDMPGRTSHGMTEAKVGRLRPLLEAQDYIDEVIWSETIQDDDLNGFRDHLNRNGNLADAHLLTQGKEWVHRSAKWLEVDPDYRKPVIFSRSHRYRNDNFDWGRIADAYRDRAGFVGFPDEYEDFCRRFGDVPLVEARDFMELAQVIAGAKLFVGNQSSPLAVAHGLKQNVIMEIYNGNGNAREHCVFQRMNCIIGWDHRIELPDLQTL